MLTYMPKIGINQYNQRCQKLASINISKTRKNATVEYLDYQIPVTQQMGLKGNGDMQVVMWAVDRFKRYAR